METFGNFWGKFLKNLLLSKNFNHAPNILENSIDEKWNIERFESLVRISISVSDLTSQLPQ